MSENDNAKYSTEENARGCDAALRRALNTAPQPKHGKVKESNQEKEPNLARL
jgi:hypothetical protein